MWHIVEIDLPIVSFGGYFTALSRLAHDVRPHSCLETDRPRPFEEVSDFTPAALELAALHL